MFRPFRPGIVHRIDKDTSGLLVVAKNDLAHAALSEQIKEHSVKREYEAVVYGRKKEDEGTVDAPIGFLHPRSGEYMDFKSPLPDYFTNFLRGLRETD